MAPATRRSSGLGSHANGPSNLDHILEHFNQFKRKHIVQNRDIIKTNALAQLRIKELEDKVLALEAERAACKLDVIRMQSRLDRAESAARAVRKGWQLVGAGIAALTAVEGFDLLTHDDHNGGDARHGMQTYPSAYERPSMHITLDRNALPGGVARNVARAPEKGLNDLLEETSAELSTGSAHRSQLHLDDEATREDGNDDEDDDDDDEDEDDGDPVSFSVDDDTIKMNGSPDVSGPVVQQHTPTITLTNTGQASAGSVTMDRRLNRMTSIDSLSSFADDEEVELSTDDDDTRNDNVVAKRPASAAAEQRLSAHNPATAKGAGRKRKSPSSPGNASSRASSVTSTPDKEVRARGGRRRGYDAGEDEQDEDDGTMSASQSEDDSYLPSSRESRHSRRSSMRDRKSVNYALPKLNTKMRKPDPVDLVPAARGEARRRRGSEDASDEGVVCSSGELAQGDDRGRMQNDNATSSAGDGPDDSEHRTAEAARIRTLKGKHEVASAGNLRDLRQKHQRQQEYAARRDGVPAMLDDTLSSSSREHSETAGEEARSESPRRRSSRKSLHERTSSSSLPASEPSDSHDGVEREPDAASSLERVKTTTESKTLSNGSHAVPSTPKWRATQASSAGAARQLPSVTGTPIPRPTVRAAGGNAQGIKALSVAGRMQRAPSSTTTSAQQQQQRAAVGSNGGKASVAVANGISASTNVLGTSARVNSSQLSQRSVSAGHAPQSTPAANTNGSAHQSPTLAGNAGDPTKRSSLHAALTSNEAFATLSASLAGVRTNSTSSSD